jgi:gentisate 1,2-dioxygenase
MSARTKPSPPSDADTRAAYRADLLTLNAKPLWERTMSMGPGNDAVPAIWHYRDMRPRLLRAAELVTTEEAERRVLMLENPGLPGSTYILTSIYSGLQIILPGEIARAHRHSTNAMRFILEGRGAYSSVEGERVMMNPGDFVLTPYFTWHDHGHVGTEPVIWLDALDNPMAKFFGAMFRENYPGETQPVTRAPNEAEMRYGAHLLPVDYRPGARSSPLMLYPYDRSREALLKLSRIGPIDPAQGVKLRYANPASGGHPFPTIAVFLQWLPKGFDGAAYRATDGTVMCCVEGSGSIVFGDRELAFEKGDVWCAPPWVTYRFKTDSEAVVFSYSDRAAQEALGFWREERGA